MKTPGDLDRVDRATLWIWRASNIAGWWLAGASAYGVVSIVLGRTFVQKVAYETIGFQTSLALIGVVAFASATAGRIVGGHVYRAPAAVGAAAVLVPWAFVAVLSVAGGGLGDLLIIGAPYVVVPTVVSASVAAVAWRNRPSGLRAHSGPLW